MGLSRMIGSITGANRQAATNRLIHEMDPGPQPGIPDFINQIDPNTGYLKGPYTVTDVNDDAYNQILADYRAKAFLPENERSAFAKVLEEKANQEEAQNLQSTLAQNLARQAEAKQNLAMRGGVSRGMAERLSQVGMKDTNAALQGVRAKAANQRLDIVGQDLSSRQQLMDRLAGMEAGNRGYLDTRQQYNIGNALAEIQNKRGYDMDKYANQMNAWAAAKQGQATLASGGKK